MATEDPVKVTQQLYAELAGRRTAVRQLAKYYDGAHPLAFASEKFLKAFGGLFHAFADNWCPLVVGSVEERMQVQGFRAIGESTSEENQPEQVKADDDASRIWEMNDLDLQSSICHTEALAFGAAFVTVWPNKAEKAEITVESATSAIVRRHPKIRHLTTAALRVWTDDKGFEHAETFVNGRVYLFRSRSRNAQGLQYPERSKWIPEDDPETLAGMSLDAASSMPNPMKRPPVVELMNSPRLTRDRSVGWFAHSELTPIIPLQDAVNKMTADMLVAAEFAAYPQRFVTKWEPEEDEETNEVIAPKLDNSPGSFFWTEADVNFGAFPTMDIQQYTKSIEMLVQHIASISSTPPHYLNGSADRLSGESLKSAETGLVAKTRRKMRTFGPCWEEVMRLAGAVENIDALKGAVRMETIWDDPETRSESEHVDAVLKKMAVKVPEPQLWTELGYSPDEVKRFPAMRAQMELEGLVAATALAAVPVAAPQIGPEQLPLPIGA